MYAIQDMYDKQRGRKRGMGSDADSDDGQLGFDSSRPKKEIMSEEQVCSTSHAHCTTALSPPAILCS